ncbi:carboxypeptidase regulatory-like domain-containing protein [Lutibacter sp.]|uniref:TonB-dependent receptor n=1 Tax=Lutibacter sp. TaxID=1925666 RepID=UPI0027339D87|nr:carboxypeptidase regulatory-like domain-containing protein [Lutibacter sp.]MDP3314367.1 carboxypeptidase regulatory-like domain-containing protein [Lutibacter sp.]
MRNLKNWLIALVFITTASMFGQGVTTSSINGKILDNNGAPLPGANVVAVHTESGTKYGVSTDFDGYFRISNMRAGGPYNITLSYVGFNDYAQNNVYLQLGQTFAINHKMVEAANALQEVVITGALNGVFDGNKTGTGTYVSKKQIETLPTVSRGIGDFLRTTPQAQVSGSTISIGGQNNRYNAIYIDGAVNNDVFGLASSGTNGGQTGVNPISVDAIESFQVSVAPFDVRISGFSGGAISAVTRSGTNNFEGSVYGFIRNESLAGKTPVDLVPSGGSREKLSDFSAKTFGVRASGAITKDKLFYFVNYENQNDETPRPFNFANYIGTSNESAIQGLSNFLTTTYGFNPGTYLSTADELKSDKLVVKLDWNINENNKLSFKHSYVNAEQINASTSNTTSINFSSGSIYFPSTTNTTSVELNSKLSEKTSNSLTLAYTSVLDDRDPLGDPFPRVRIKDGSGNIFFGSEPFSTGNILEQKIMTLTDNFEIYKGAHTITLGTHLESSDVRNVFIRQNYGDYVFTNLNRFLTGGLAEDYNRSYSLQGGIGDDSKGAAEFDMFQVGVYVQDEIQATDNLKLTIGLRFDAPIWSDGLVNDSFNNTTVGLLEAQGKDLQGARVGKGVSTSIHISPRVGFNWNVNGESDTQVRGGFGIFTSRVPLVWPGAVYNNNGMAIGAAEERNLPGGGLFVADPFGQPVGPAVGSGQLGGDINLFSSDFKLPQVFKVNLAVDQKLPFWGLVASADLLYNKNISAVYYENLNLKAPILFQSGTGDTRPYYNRSSRIDPTYFGIYLGSNTSEGHSWNSSLTITKPLANGFQGSVSYGYGDSQTIFEGTSSQNSSQWRNQLSVNGKNSKLPTSRSQFAQGHRVIANGSYDIKWNDNIKTTFGLFYQGVNGNSFTYTYQEGQDVLNDDSSDNAVIYVPKNAADIRLKEGANGLTAAQQWTALDGFIQGNDYLRSRRGKYAEINADRAPWSHIVDLKVLQDFSIKFGEKKHTFQASFDIFNFTNLINKEWGVQKFAPNFGEIDILRTETAGVAPVYSFNPAVIDNMFTIDDSGIESSRWQMQVGIRYSFN